MNLKKKELTTLDTEMQELLDVPLPSPPERGEIQIKDESNRRPHGVGPELLPNLPPEDPK